MFLVDFKKLVFILMFYTCKCNVFSHVKQKNIKHLEFKFN